MTGPVRVELTEAETSRASRAYWNAAAGEYLAEHGDFLGDDRFIWCPEGVDEEYARLLGPRNATHRTADHHRRCVTQAGTDSESSSQWKGPAGSR